MDFPNEVVINSFTEETGNVLLAVSKTTKEVREFIDIAPGPDVYATAIAGSYGNEMFVWQYDSRTGLELYVTKGSTTELVKVRLSLT